jgi:hypothetical protein
MLSSLNTSTITQEVKTSFFNVWHIITAKNLLLGIIFLIMSVQRNLSRVRFVAMFIAALMITRWLVIFRGILLYNAALKCTG